MWKIIGKGSVHHLDLKPDGAESAIAIELAR